MPVTAHALPFGDNATAYMVRELVVWTMWGDFPCTQHETVPVCDACATVREAAEATVDATCKGCGHRCSPRAEPGEPSAQQTAGSSASVWRDDAKAVSYPVSSYQANIPQLEVKVDRVKAKAQGVALSDLFETLHDLHQRLQQVRPRLQGLWPKLTRHTASRLKISATSGRATRAAIWCRSIRW